MMILNRIKLAVDRAIAAFSVAVMIALVVCVVWQVFSRYVLNQPSTLTDELARFLMIWVGLLGAAYTVGAQRHLAIDLLAMTLPPRRQALLSVIINLLIFIFAGSVIVTGGVKLIEKTLSTSQVSAAMQIPMGYVYLILPLTGIMMVANLCIGLLTPPVGSALFVGCSISGVKIQQLIKPLLPFYAALLIALMMIVYIPQISLFIPQLLGLM